MGRKKVNYKVGETISFMFAGSKETGKIVRVTGNGNNIRYSVYDGSYTYPVSKEMIL